MDNALVYVSPNEEHFEGYPEQVILGVSLYGWTLVVKCAMAKVGVVRTTL
jgi:hypothetical protein